MRRNDQLVSVQFTRQYTGFTNLNFWATTLSMGETMNGSDLQLCSYLYPSIDSNVIFQFMFGLKLGLFLLKKKKQDVQSSQESVDLISNLSEDIVNSILVRMPIREAIRTSILSRKWRYKWNFIPDIVFNKDCLMEGASTTTHATVVDHVLLHHVGSISKFTCRSYVPRCSHIDSWILFLSRNGIKKLTLAIRPGNDRYDVPSSIFLCQELCHLHLSCCYLKVAPTFNDFHNLLVLKLNCFIISTDDLACLISKSPLLERLTLEFLRPAGCLNIHAPNLRYLKLHGTFQDVLLVTSQHLTDASIRFWHILEQHKTCTLFPFNGCFQGIERLALMDGSLKVLLNGDVQEKLPAPFDRLKYLEVEMELYSKEVLATLCIFKSSPNLKELKIKFHVNWEKRRLFPSEEEAELWSAKIQFDGLLSNLHTAEINGVAMLLDLKFIWCILSKSPVLETMKVYTNQYVNHEEVLKITKELLRFQRAFAQVEIIYLGHS